MRVFLGDEEEWARCISDILSSLRVSLQDVRTDFVVKLDRHTRLFAGVGSGGAEDSDDEDAALNSS